MSEIGRVAAVAVVAALCAVLTRKAAPEFAIVLALAAGAMILLFAAERCPLCWISWMTWLRPGDCPSRW